MTETISDAPHPHDAFFVQYGKALASWAVIEDFLCIGFCIMCKMSPMSGMGRALFFSGRSFATRADLLSAAIKTGGIDDEELWRAIVKKAQQFSTARNIIAHGVPVSLYTEGKPYPGVVIKEGEGAWNEGGVGIAQLKEAEMHFDDLCELVRHAIWHSMPPAECLLRVQALPKAAFAPEPAQSPPGNGLQPPP